MDNTRYEFILTHPFVTGLTTIAGVLAGYLGAHFDHDIAASFLRLWFADGRKLDAGATSFWIALLAFGFMFAYSGAAQARRADRFSTNLASISSGIDSKTDALRERAEEIDVRVRLLYTLPPAGFLEEYRGAILNATQSLFFSLPDCKLPHDSRELAIRVQLVNILALVREFDTDGKKARYGCNIMLFRRSSDMSDADAAKYESMLRFADRAISVKKLYGVLELQPELSVSSDSTSAEPDTKLTPFCLPVPASSLDMGDEFTVDVLPGAVDAFSSKKVAVIETPADWLERCKSGAFGGQVARDMMAFFDAEKDTIQSILSFPLLAPADLEEVEREVAAQIPIAILNLHRNVPNELAAEKLELLEPLLTPSLQFVAYLLSLEAGAILDRTEELMQ